MIVLLTGAGGLLGRALQVELPPLGLTVVPRVHSELDVTDQKQVTDAVQTCRPDVVLNCAAYTRVDDAETEEMEALRINAGGAATVAQVCAQLGVRVVYPSTDYVFDGAKHSPLRPDDHPQPINAYGRSKMAGEAATRAAAPDALIVRTSWLFGGGGPNFVRTVAHKVESGEKIRVVSDQTGRPTYARDLAQAIGRLLLTDGSSGVYHLANKGQTTWFGLAQEVAALLGRSELVTPCTTAEFPRPAARPGFSVLDTSASDRLIGPLRSWRDAVAEAVSRHDY